MCIRDRSYTTPWVSGSLSDRMHAMLTDLNVASNKGLSERFDSTIGAGTVLMPFGGKKQLTPNMAMVAKLPVFGETTTASAMAWGFNPFIMEKNQFTGAYPVSYTHLDVYKRQLLHEARTWWL